jgi:hypothetical protein
MESVAYWRGKQQNSHLRTELNFAAFANRYTNIFFAAHSAHTAILLHRLQPTLPRNMSPQFSGSKNNRRNKRKSQWQDPPVIFDPEDGGITFFRDVDSLLTDYTALYPGIELFITSNPTRPLLTTRQVKLHVCYTGKSLMGIFITHKQNHCCRDFYTLLCIGTKLGSYLER